MRRETLVALHFAAAGAALSACQGGGGTIAVAGNEPGGTPPADFCAAHEPSRILWADPSNYRRMILGLVPGDTLVLAAGEYPRLTMANLAGAPGRCVTITGPAGDVIFAEIPIAGLGRGENGNIVFEPVRAIERSALPQ